LKLTLLWMILSLSTVVLFPTSLHHQSCAIPGEFLQYLAQDQFPCVVIKHQKTGS
jgi:hypothetical protein